MKVIVDRRPKGQSWPDWGEQAFDFRRNKGKASQADGACGLGHRFAMSKGRSLQRKGARAGAKAQFENHHVSDQG